VAAARILLALLLIPAALARGQVSVSLPLQGHFRPGRYMPVRLQTRGYSGSVTIAARGAVPTEYPAAGNADVVVPWLVLVSGPGEVQVSAAGHPKLSLHALADDERLVAVAGEEGDAAPSLFPGLKIVAVPLDLSRPLLDPPQAWESLDAVVLSEAAAQQLKSRQIDVLASAGVALAVRASHPPDHRWPWKRQGNLWVLRYDPAGPSHAIEPAGYTPTYGWERGWPVAFRRQLLFAALVFVLLAVGLALWRSRWAAIAMILFCAVAAGLFGWWHARKSPMLMLAGGIIVSDGPVAQVDLWHWFSPLRETAGQFPADGLTYPILSDLRDATQTQFRLVCAADGSPASFTFRLAPREALAFLTRLLRTETTHPALAPAAEPFKRFAEDLYLRPGESIAGQFLAADPISGRPIPIVLARRGTAR
jgi:hypothetical protein